MACPCRDLAVCVCDEVDVFGSEVEVAPAS